MARADVDHNGKLDMKEFIRMMHNYNTEMTDPETEDLQRTREIMEAFRCKRRKIIDTTFTFLTLYTVKFLKLSSS